MSKINETNYPRRTQANYADTDMLIIQAAGGNTYTTRIEDLRDDCQETIAPIVEAVNDALAPPENGSTASQSYAIGEHFMRNGDFCTAIAAITSGASFTLNTNYVVGTIAEALESLNSDLASLTEAISVTASSDTCGSIITKLVNAMTASKVSAHSVIFNGGDNYFYHIIAENVFSCSQLLSDGSVRLRQLDLSSKTWKVVDIANGGTVTVNDYTNTSMPNGRQLILYYH